MPIVPSTLERDIESISKITTIALKFGALVGGICVVVYSLTINYFPQDLSLGDGLLFIMAAACFGVIYTLFIACLVSLGVILSLPIKIVAKFIVWVLNKIGRQKFALIHPLAPFEWLAVPFTPIAVFIIYSLGTKNSGVYWNLSLFSVALYLLYSIYLSYGNKIKKARVTKGAVAHAEDTENLAQQENESKLRTGQLISLALIFVLPLMFGGVSGQLLSAAMRAAHVRIENPVIYVREPYSELLPKSLASESHISPKDFTAFVGTVVLFNGFGKRTVISFPDGTKTRKLEIPNDQIIVEDR